MEMNPQEIEQLQVTARFNDFLQTSMCYNQLESVKWEDVKWIWQKNKKTIKYY